MKPEIKIPSLHKDTSKIKISPVPKSGIKTVTVFAVNRAGQSTSGASPKLDLQMYLFYKDGTGVGPYDISKTVKPGDLQLVKVNVLDELPNEALFYWKEKFGSTSILRSSHFYTPSELTLPLWNAVWCQWSIDSINGDIYEFCDGGCSHTSNLP